MSEAEVDTGDLWRELLAVAAADDEASQERTAEIVRTLNRQGAPEVVDWALPLLADEAAWRRDLAAWVLGEHGFEEGRPFGAWVAPALAAAARRELDVHARASMVISLGRAEDPAWADELIRYAGDPEPAVREAVASHLPLIFAGDEMSSAAVDALLVLTTDSDPRVRDWATTALGSLSELDTPQIREALFARLDDDDDDGEVATPGEAALGLALRHDSRVAPYLQRWLEEDVEDIGNLIIEAVGALGDPTFLPRLQELKRLGWQDSEPRPEVLDAAIATLSGEQPTK